MKGDIELNHNHTIMELDENISWVDIAKYNISDFKKAAETTNYKISINMENNCIYEKNCEINITIDNFSNQDNYKVRYGKNDNVIEMELKDKETNLTYELSEGENLINIQIYKDNSLKKEEKEKIFYVKPYEKQFLDELTENSVTTHYRTGKYENYELSVNLLKHLGANYIRTDFFWGYIYLDQEYNFSKYDQWVNKLKEDVPNIKILGILNSSASIVGNDKKIDTEEELKGFVEFCINVAKHYPEIENYQILNEPNSIYVTSEDIEWYDRIIEEASTALKEINPDIEIMQYSLSAGTNDTNTYLSSKTFYEKAFNNKIYSLSDSFSYNIYYDLESKIQTHKDQFNDFGGFIKQDITEYGTSTYNGMSEEMQANQIIIQANQLEEKNIALKNIYNFWNTGTDLEDKSQNYGLLRNDYTPKPAYYAVKNYYENTNGAEYVGTVNLADGLEAHVYDKDGKPKIIVWATSDNSPITIDYKEFMAKDLYGNNIENTNGTLGITTSPVYLDNISTNYFYQAISNTIIEKYTKFEEKFGTEIANVEGLQETIDLLKQYMLSISNIENESEDIAKQKMKEHFNLGNQILEAYKNGKLDIEYVKLSSMLDMLNDIGNSYEDLVTVSSITRNPDLEGTETVIDSIEQKINDNSDIEIVYPTKILEFSKDLYEKAEYINNLEEENDIKTGLIVSYDLHAKYLADWAETFTNIYIDKYIEANPVTVTYSDMSEWTNKDVIATLNIGSDAKVTNNEGNNTYTFKENGSFSFEYERRGRTFSQEVKVENIDKILPEISNIENGKIYFESVIPNVNDEHLGKVQVTLNGQAIEGYSLGNELTEEGQYELVATDKAGNVTKVVFYIFLNDENGYQIKDNNIMNIYPETTVKEFKEAFTLLKEYVIKNVDKELTEEDNIATGNVLEDDEGKIFTLIVLGDLNQDGKLSLSDISLERKYILKMIDLSEIQKLATDVNFDNNISLTDISIMRKLVLEMK